MTEAEFNALAAQGYNRIPVCREVLADLRAGKLSADEALQILRGDGD